MRARLRLLACDNSLRHWELPFWPLGTILRHRVFLLPSRDKIIPTWDNRRKTNICTTESLPKVMRSHNSIPQLQVPHKKSNQTKTNGSDTGSDTGATGATREGQKERRGSDGSDKGSDKGSDTGSDGSDTRSDTGATQPRRLCRFCSWGMELRLRITVGSDSVV